MAISYSSRITTRNLALSVDAANPASLPTNIPTNLVPAGSRENLSTWIRQDTTIQTDVTTAPDGTLTADAVFDTASNTTHIISFNAANVQSPSASIHTWSVYVKAGNQISNITLILFGPTSQPSRQFNLLTGTSSGSVLGNAATIFSITPAGNGWYRCSVSGLLSTAANTLTIYLFQNNNFSYAGGTGSIFLWGAQCEPGSTLTPYYPVSTSDSALNTRWNDLTGTSRPVTNSLTSVELLVVGGGGAGGAGNGGGYETGGGGAGGVIYNATYPVIPNTTYPVTVGLGGTGTSSGGLPTLNGSTNGENSIFGILIAFGGGAGGSGGFGGNSGGSGGGGAYLTSSVRSLGGMGIPNQGNAGGQAAQVQLGDGTNRGGGGGGAGGPGQAAIAGGVGGVGVAYSISGISTYYGGGGGGNNNAAGGLGGGGVGGQLASNGVVNTGGGGGGGSWDGSSANPIGKGANGGSGIVIVRYPAPQRASGGIVSTSGGFVTHTFTAGSDNFVVTSPIIENRSYGSFVNVTTPILYDSRASGSLVFNNLDNYVAMPDLPSQTNSPLSVFAWVYLNATPVGTNGIWGHFGVNNNNIHYEINPTATRLRLGDTNKADLPMLAIGSWQFVGFTSTGSSHRYYVNGVLSTTWAGNTGTILGSSGAVPTSHMVGRSDATRVWNGRIAHVAVYTDELTATEVLNNYNALRGRYGV